MYAALSEFLQTSTTRRHLQFELPDYTSPPLAEAIEATPEAYRSNETVDAARDLDASGLCVGDAAEENAEACQIKFMPADYTDSTVGVIYFGGALVDPRGYSPLMQMLAETYALPISVPIFANDLPFKFGTCESGRLTQAQIAFPSVQKWIFAGHSMGGVAAYNDVWAMSQRNETDAIGGLVLIGSYVNPQDIGCGMADFSESQLPMASVSASEDLIVDATNFEAGQDLLPFDSLKFVNKVIEGGNHGGFGSYDYSERKALLNQTDGNATITNEEQQSQTSEVIGDVALLVMDEISRDAVPSETAGDEVVDDVGISATQAPSPSASSNEVSRNGEDGDEVETGNESTSYADDSETSNAADYLVGIVGYTSINAVASFLFWVLN